ncbi:MAG: helix-turn-helix domain-containing protein [Cytophagales bacterium]|nr:helix-turn-helix domain-containing protein [Cytophagales bacterium]
MDRIEEMWGKVEPGTKEGNEFELLCLVIEKYDDEHFPIPSPDPIEAIKFRMDQQGLKPKDLVQYIGHKSTVSKVLKKQRDLTVEMIRNLSKGLNIPAEMLLG